MGLRLLASIDDAAILFEQLDQLPKFCNGKTRVFKDGGHARAIRLGCLGPGIDQRQGHLALPQVRAGRFTHHKAILGVIQQVIGHLKGQAQMVAVVRQGVDLVCCCMGQQGPGPTGALKQHGRLAADHLQVSRFGQGEVSFCLQLPNFSLGHCFGNLGDHTDHRQQSRIGGNG